MKKIGALGLVETYGLVGAIEAVDIALKTADVELLGIEKLKGGLVTMQITGDVSAVKASVEAAVISAGKISKVIASHVIPRPYEDVEIILNSKSISDEESEEVIEEAIEEVIEEALEEAIEEVIEEALEEAIEEVMEEALEGIIEDTLEEEVGVDKEMQYDLEELTAMKVVDLRSLVRELPGIKIKRNQIKFMNKEELLTAIQEYYKS